MNPTTETAAEISRLRAEIKKGTRVISISGLTGIAAKAFVLSRLQTETGKIFVVVADANKELENWECDLEFFQNSVQSPKSKVQSPTENSSQFSVLSSQFSLPSFETDIYSGISPHAETQEKRALALWNLTRSKPDFLILSAKALIAKTISPDEIKNLGTILKRDADFPPEDLIEKLVAGGYRREEPIKNIGEFSVRGGILDVWSPTYENPARIEFFGDTIDSIRAFDAETQLSVGQLKEISIAPMREFAAVSKDFNDWSFFARERFADEKFVRNLKDRTDFADEGEDFSGWEFLFPLVQPRRSSVFDYLAECVFIIDEPPIVEQTLANYYETLETRYAEISETGEIGLEPTELFLSGEILREKFEKFQRIELRALGRTAAAIDEEFQTSS